MIAILLVTSAVASAVSLGALDRARQLDRFGLLRITPQFRRNTGFGTAWKPGLPAAR
jgi:hypothetical protein